MGKIGAGGQAGSPGHGGFGTNPGLSLSISAVRGALSLPRLSVLTSEGLPDALSPASLFPQPLPLISPNQETQKQCLNLGGGSHVPSVPGRAGASLPSEWQMIPGGMNSAEPAPTACSERSILGPGSPCPFLPGPWLSPQAPAQPDCSWHLCLDQCPDLGTWTRS